MEWNRKNPPAPGEYLVYIRPHIWLAYWTGERWEQGVNVLTRVTHWYPLPDPPPKPLGRKISDRLLGREARREKTLGILREET
jgi:hypothetical protein